jgi:hypothetical protein
MTLALILPEFASISSDIASLGGLLVPLGGMLFVAVIIVTSHWFKNQERQRWHETARIALEKGQPIPSRADLLDEKVVDKLLATSRPAATCRHRQVMGFVAGGLINVAVGVGLYFGLAHMPGAEDARYFALIPGLIGVALLIVGLLYAYLFRSTFDSGDRPPQS